MKKENKENKEIKITKKSKDVNLASKAESDSNQNSEGPLSFLRASLTKYTDCLSRL
jgi:hypothetical protein